MRLVEFYKEMYSILVEYHNQDIDEGEARDQIEELKIKANDMGLIVIVEPDIIKNIHVYDCDETYEGYDDEYSSEENN